MKARRGAAGRLPREAASGLFVASALAISPVAGASQALAHVCVEEVVRSAPSPSGDVVATVVRKSCGVVVGAERPISTAIYLLPASMDFMKDVAKRWNAFFFLAAEGIDIAIEWGLVPQEPSGKSRLKVTHSNSDRIGRKAVVWDGISIDYIEH